MCRIYAGDLIEKFLLIKQEKQPVFNEQNVPDSVVHLLLERLIKALQQTMDASVFKGLFFTLKVAGSRLVSFIQPLSNVLSDLMKELIANESAQMA